MEKCSYLTTDMKIMSSSILHRFKFDGIEYQQNVQATENILPFSGTGTQRIKHKLIEELIPGKIEALPVHVLSQEERCILHQAISNTILRPDNENTYKSCSQITDYKQTEKLTDKIMLTDMWNCPRQQGVILTPYGTVAPGIIIGAIAASLQHQNIAVNQLVTSLKISHPEMNSTNIYNLKYDEEEIDFVLPRSHMSHKPSMWYSALMTSSVKIDNIWLTTIAGELAEMVVYQGPLLGNNMTLGATGFWQNIMYPSIYYLLNSDENFHATRAELIGGIDGIIIASYLQTWIQDFYSLRLSQILEMYYSYEGITLNTNVKACNRGQIFFYALPKTILNEQTYAIAQMLAYRKSIAYISPQALQRMVEFATEKFYTYAKDYLFPELPCYEINKPQVEALIVFDGAWSIGYTIDFLAILIQDLDVSMYGSKIGIIHSTTGEWLLNVTNSPSTAFQALNKFTNDTWPMQFNYTRVLETISAYLNKTWEYNYKNHIIGNLGQIHTFGYGTMKACLWMGFESNDKTNLHCTELAGYKEITLTDHLRCTSTTPCPNLYLRIQNVTSLYKCAEIDCKTPDQVRYIIRTNQQIVRYDNFANKNMILISLNMLALFTLRVLV
ncbi:hypothetical protein WN48_06061 [Eufriesea mexicana]|nr:hypothetical protein WN48_06061 [Eufriesea mexicana]